MKTGLLLTTVASLAFCIGLYLWRDEINRLLLDGTASPVAMQVLALAVFARLVLRHVWATMNAVQEYRWIAITRTTEHVMRAVGSVAFYILWGITASIVALAASSVLGLIFAMVVLRHISRADGSWAGTLYTLSVGWPYYAANLCSNLRTRVDYLLVGMLGGAAPLATYFVAEKIYEYLGHLSRNLLDTTQTKIAEQSVEGTAALSRSFKRCTRYFFLGLVPVYFVCAAMSSVIVDVYAGGNYPEAEAVLAVLCAAALIGWFFALHRRYVLVVGRRWHPLALDAASLISSASFIAVCMVFFGPVGAAFGKAVAALPLVALSYLLLSGGLHPRYDVSAIWIGLGSGASMLLLTQVLMWLLPSNTGALVAMAIMLPIYYLFVRRRLQRRDLDMVIEMIPDKVRRSRWASKLETVLRDDLLSRDAPNVAAE